MVYPDSIITHFFEKGHQAFQRALFHPVSCGIVHMSPSALAYVAEKGTVILEIQPPCVAGTGRFLEVMATALEFTLEEFSKAALSAARAVKILLAAEQRGPEMA